MGGVHPSTRGRRWRGASSGCLLFLSAAGTSVHSKGTSHPSLDGEARLQPNVRDLLLTLAGSKCVQGWSPGKLTCPTCLATCTFSVR